MSGLHRSSIPHAQTRSIKQKSKVNVITLQCIPPLMNGLINYEFSAFISVFNVILKTMYDPEGFDHEM